MPVSLESLSILLDSVSNLNGLRRDIKNNAAGYLSALSNGVPVDDVVAVINADFAQYKRRLGWQKTLADTPAERAKLSSAAQGVGADINEIIGIYQELVTPVDYVIANPPATAVDVAQMADYLNNNISTYTTVW